jgi:hypothetical protein
LLISTFGEIVESEYSSRPGNIPLLCLCMCFRTSPQSEAVILCMISQSRLPYVRPTEYESHETAGAA